MIVEIELGIIAVAVVLMAVETVVYSGAKLRVWVHDRRRVHRLARALVEKEEAKKRAVEDDVLVDAVVADYESQFPRPRMQEIGRSGEPPIIEGGTT